MIDGGVRIPVERVIGLLCMKYLIFFCVVPKVPKKSSELLLFAALVEGDRKLKNKVITNNLQ